MLPPNVIDGPDAARLPKGLFTSVAHGLLTQGRRMAERNQIRAHDGREKLLGFSAADELERLDREVEMTLARMRPCCRFSVSPAWLASAL